MLSRKRGLFMVKEVDEVKGISENMLQLFEEIWQIKQNKKEGTLTKESIVALCEKHDVSVEEAQNLAVEVVTLGKFKSFSDFQSDMLSDDALGKIAGGKFSARRGIATLLTAISGVGSFLGSASSAFATGSGSDRRPNFSASPRTRDAQSLNQKAYADKMNSFGTITTNIKNAAGNAAQGLSDIVGKQALYVQKTFGLNAPNASAVAGAANTALVALLLKTLGMTVSVMSGSNSPKAAPNSEETKCSSNHDWIMNFEKAVNENHIKVNINNYQNENKLTLFISDGKIKDRSFVLELTCTMASGKPDVSAQAYDCQAPKFNELKQTAAITMPYNYATTLLGMKATQLDYAEKSAHSKSRSVDDASKKPNSSNVALDTEKVAFLFDYIRTIKTYTHSATAAATEKLKALEQQLETNEAELRSKTAEIEKLNEANARLQKDFEKTSNKLSEVQTLSENAEKTVKELADEKEKLQADLETKTTQLTKLQFDFANQKTMLETYKSTAASTADETKQKLIALAGEHDQLKQKLHDTAETLAKIKAEKEKIEHDLQTANKAHDEALANVQKLIQEKNDLQIACDELSNKLHDKTEELNKQQKSIEDLTEKTDLLEKELENLKSARETPITSETVITPESPNPPPPPPPPPPLPTPVTKKHTKTLKTISSPTQPTTEDPAPSTSKTTETKTSEKKSPVFLDELKAAASKRNKPSATPTTSDTTKDPQSTSFDASLQGKLVTKKQEAKPSTPDLIKQTDPTADYADTLFTLCEKYNNGIPTENLNDVILTLSTNDWGKLSGVVNDITKFLTDMQKGLDVTKLKIMQTITVDTVGKCLAQSERASSKKQELTLSIQNMLQKTLTTLNNKPALAEQEKKKPMKTTARQT